MARTGVTQSESDRACAALAAAGKPVTVDAVLAHLGTGSKSTLTPFVREWKAKHPAGVASPAAELGLPGELVEAVQQVHRLLKAEAALEVTAARESEAAAKAAAVAALGAAAEREAALAAENARLAAQLTDALTRGAALEETVAAQELALTRLETERAGQEQRLADRAADLHTAKQQLATLQRQYAHLEERAAATLQEERRSATQRYDQLQHDHVALQRQSASLEAAVRAGERQLAQLRTDMTQMANALEVQQGAAAQARAERDQLAGTLGQAVAARDALARREQELAHQLSEVRQELAGMQGEAKILARDLKQVQERFDRLNEEKAVWRHERAQMEEMLRQRGEEQ